MSKISIYLSRTWQRMLHTLVELSRIHRSERDAPMRAGCLRVSRPTMALGAIALALGLGGCSPLSATPPFHFAETAETLRRGQVALNVSGGGGTAGLDGAGGGGGARVRVGLGKGHELGLEGTVIVVDTGEPSDDGTSPRWMGTSGAYAGKLVWKASLVPGWLALLAGAGGSYTATGTALGGDLGLIASWGRPLARVLRPYLGLRLGVAFPVGRPVCEDGGITVIGTLAPGLAIEPLPWLRLHAELDVAVAGSSLGNPDRADDGHSGKDDPSHHFAVAGVAGVTFLLGK